MSLEPKAESVKHSFYDDVMAMFLGTGLVALGLVFYAKAMLSTGSTAGIAFLIHYESGIGFGLLFFIINIPFYVFALLRMGIKFTIKSFIAVSMVSFFTMIFPDYLMIDNINPIFAVIVGGGLMGMGVLSLFRHRASMGGINLLALYLQDTYGVRAGYFQLVVDVLVLGAALFVLDFDKVVLSMLGALILNLVVALNHKTGRYMGVS